jgi:hypothetical protein
MVKFKSFKSTFIGKLADRQFGETSYDRKSSRPGSLSPAAKEVRKKSAETRLGTHAFLKSVYQFLKEHDRLTRERPKVYHITALLRPQIRAVRKAQKTLKIIQSRIQELENSIEEFVGWDVRQQLHDAIRQLKSSQDDLLRLEQECGSMLHSAERKDHKISPWEFLIKPFRYDFSTLKQKAPDQWLIEMLDSTVRSKLCDPGIIKITKLTRYRIITELLYAGGLGEIRPLTIKQYLYEREIASKSARISRPS